MPADVPAAADSEPMMAAIPDPSMSAQLKERMEREKRSAAVARQLEIRELLEKIQDDLDDIRRRLRQSI